MPPSEASASPISQRCVRLSLQAVRTQQASALNPILFLFIVHQLETATLVEKQWGFNLAVYLDQPRISKSILQPVIPRKQLDIGWTDILFGLKQCLWPANHRKTKARSESNGASNWASNKEKTLVCLSVRSGFDALLTALNLQPGDEILISAVTIRGMVSIVEAHNLVPIPIDIEPDRLVVRPESMFSAVSDRTKAIVVAHLFGSRMPMEPILHFAKAYNLLVIEDCAQAYVGHEYCGHLQSDVSLFSFGPIKTNTALAGGILRFRERSLCHAVRLQQAQWPTQSRWQFCKRLCKYALLKLLSYQATYTLFVGICALLKVSHDSIISNSVRGFPGDRVFSQIRQQPSTVLLALLKRRIEQFDAKRITERVRLAKMLLSLAPMLKTPGSLAIHHTYWVFPILCEHPDSLMHHLWRHGFDATKGGSSLYVVEAPADRPESVPTKAQQMFQQLLYLPCYTGLSSQEIERLAIALKEYFTDE